MSESFPFVEIRGGPRARGRQFGEACRAQVRGYADTLLRVLAGEARLRSLDAGTGGASGPNGAARANGRAARAQLTRDALYARALTFLPAFEAFAPHLVEEIRGIA